MSGTEEFDESSGSAERHDEGGESLDPECDLQARVTQLESELAAARRQLELKRRTEELERELAETNQALAEEDSTAGTPEMDRSATPAATGDSVHSPARSKPIATPPLGSPISETALAATPSTRVSTDMDVAPDGWGDWLCGKCGCVLRVTSADLGEVVFCESCGQQCSLVPARSPSTAGGVEAQGFAEGQQAVVAGSEETGQGIGGKLLGFVVLAASVWILQKVLGWGLFKTMAE